MRNIPRKKSTTAGLAFLLATVISGHLYAETASDKWFSVVSILKHKAALGRAHDVELSGNLAFVPGKDGSIAIIDIARPQDPELLWHKEGLGDSETALIYGNHLLLGTTNFYSMDISDPRNPVFLKKVSEPTDRRIDKINGMVKRGHTVFAANKSGWINAFDISDIKSPTLAGSLNVSEKYDLMSPHDIDSVGEFVIIVDPRKFGRSPTGTGKIALIKAIDTASGQALPADEWTLAGEIESKQLSGANRVQVSGSFAYTTCSYGPERPNRAPKLVVIDISNPHSPRIAAAVPSDSNHGPNGLTIAGKIAFLAGGETIEAVDITDPLHPVKLGSQKLPASNMNPDSSYAKGFRKTDNAHDLVFRDGHLYVSCQSDDSFMILKIDDERILSLAESR
jgi:hypothetical protein